VLHNNPVAMTGSATQTALNETRLLILGVQVLLDLTLEKISTVCPHADMQSKILMTVRRFLDRSLFPQGLQALACALFEPRQID
jgi:hypothetical protein